MIVTGSTKLLGLIGYPVKHSLSPIMHNAALAALGLDYLYLPFPLTPEQLTQGVKGLAALSIEGFNVTIPHKQSILPLLNDIQPQAQMIGAVNTVYRLSTPDQGWGGTNTDLEGFLVPLRQLSPRPWGEITATILGSGGAARAVIQGCIELGVTTIQVVGRSSEKLVTLQTTWPQISGYSWSDLLQLLPSTQLLINTTPIGMAPQETPVSADQIVKLPQTAIVYDLIYTPNPTYLLQLAATYGYTTIDGLEMLIQQGAAALSLWLDRSVPIETMRQAAWQYLMGS